MCACMLQLSRQCEWASNGSSSHDSSTGSGRTSPVWLQDTVVARKAAAATAAADTVQARRLPSPLGKQAWQLLNCAACRDKTPKNQPSPPPARPQTRTIVSPAQGKLLFCAPSSPACYRAPPSNPGRRALSPPPSPLEHHEHLAAISGADAGPAIAPDSCPLRRLQRNPTRGHLQVWGLHNQAQGVEAATTSHQQAPATAAIAPDQ